MQCLIIQQNDVTFSSESLHIPVYFVSVGETPQVTSDKRCFNSTKYEEDFPWVYWSHKHRGWMCKICEMYLKTGGSSKNAFSTRPTDDTAHPGGSMSTHSNRKRLELKYFANNKEHAFKKMSKIAESTLRKKRQVNSLYLRKCIHSHVFFP